MLMIIKSPLEHRFFVSVKSVNSLFRCKYELEKHYSVVNLNRRSNDNDNDNTNNNSQIDSQISVSVAGINILTFSFKKVSSFLQILGYVLKKTLNRDYYLH